MPPENSHVDNDDDSFSFAVMGSVEMNSAAAAMNGVGLNIQDNTLSAEEAKEWFAAAVERHCDAINHYVRALDEADADTADPSVLEAMDTLNASLVELVAGHKLYTGELFPNPRRMRGQGRDGESDDGTEEFFTRMAEAMDAGEEDFGPRADELPGVLGLGTVLLDTPTSMVRLDRVEVDSAGVSLCVSCLVLRRDGEPTDTWVRRISDAMDGTPQILGLLEVNGEAQPDGFVGGGGGPGPWGARFECSIWIPRAATLGGLDALLSYVDPADGSLHNLSVVLGAAALNEAAAGIRAHRREGR